MFKHPACPKSSLACCLPSLPQVQYFERSSNNRVKLLKKLLVWQAPFLQIGVVDKPFLVSYPRQWFPQDVLRHTSMLWEHLKHVQAAARVLSSIRIDNMCSRALEPVVPWSLSAVTLQSQTQLLHPCFQWLLLAPGTHKLAMFVRDAFPSLLLSSLGSVFFYFLRFAPAFFSSQLKPPRPCPPSSPPFSLLLSMHTNIFSLS